MGLAEDSHGQVCWKDLGFSWNLCIAMQKPRWTPCPTGWGQLRAMSSGGQKLRRGPEMARACQGHMKLGWMMDSTG